MSQQELERPGYLALYKPRRSSLAFIVESLVLLVFLIASLAVIMQVLAASANKATESRQLEQAVILASNAAERFSADPTGIEETTMVDGLALTCKVSETALAQGTRYEASITVFSENGEIYRLNTARYVPRAFTGVTADNAAGNFRRDLPGVIKAEQIIYKYVEVVDDREKEKMLNELMDIEEQWEEQAAGVGELWYRKINKTSLLRPDTEENSRFRIMNSMRSVEASSGIYLLG